MNEGPVNSFIRCILEGTWYKLVKTSKQEAQAKTGYSWGSKLTSAIKRNKVVQGPLQKQNLALSYWIQNVE